MKFSAVILAAAAGVSANGYGNVTVTTEIVQSYTTYCPEATEITHGTKTYTVTAPTTLTITDCPCTVTKPVIPTSVVVCHTCGVFTNSTVATVPVTQGPPGTQVPTTVSAQPPVQTQPGQPPVTGGASKAFAGLAGVVGLAALVL